MTIALDPCKDELAKLILEELLTLPNSADLNLSNADLYAMLEKPPEDHMGDFSLPCFRFAKALKLPPPKIAAMLSDRLATKNSQWIEKTAVLNAFLNIFASKSQMAAHTVGLVLDGKFFADPIAPKSSQGRVMVEYSQPNTHKDFHVGHMRNVCLGSSLVKLYRYCGFDVTAVNYYGDEGAHIAKCLWMMMRMGTKPSPTDDKGSWLGAIYTASAQALEAASPDVRATYDQEISAVLRGIESKAGPWFELWKETRSWSLDAFARVYEWIDAEFDHNFYESEVSEESQQLVEQYLKKGVFKEDQGAVGADLNDFKLGFMLVKKRDGNTLYATKDLVLARRKFDEFKIDRSIYVVANEQNHHFRQVFKTLDLMGFPQAAQCFHLSYGMVVGPTGKMSSRDGTAVPFMQLKDRMLEEIHAILAKYTSQWDQAEIDETARRLCVGAIKYGMLHADPAREIVFDLKDWLSFEGNTGPYLMYGYSRAQSVLRKAAEQNLTPLLPSELAGLEFKLTEAPEMELLRALYDFNQVVKDSCLHNRPSHLCTHLYYMCKGFSRFYAEVPVLKASDAATARMRLTLVDAYRKTLKQGLSLLGITPPERM